MKRAEWNGLRKGISTKMNIKKDIMVSVEDVKFKIFSENCKNYSDNMNNKKEI